jgi:hypothetical protein
MLSRLTRVGEAPGKEKNVPEGVQYPALIVARVLETKPSADETKRCSIAACRVVVRALRRWIAATERLGGSANAD